MKHGAYEIKQQQLFKHRQLTLTNPPNAKTNWGVTTFCSWQLSVRFITAMLILLLLKGNKISSKWKAAVWDEKKKRKIYI